MKKRVIAALAAGVLAVGMFAGCGKSTAQKVDDAEKKVEEAVESGDEKKVEEAAAAVESTAKDVAADVGEITMILSSRDEFLSTLEAGALAAAADLGIKLTTVDAQNDTSKMQQFVETAKNAGQKAVIINPIDADACDTLIQAAGDMKVIFVNRPPTDTAKTLSKNAVYVGSDEMKSGYYQGEALSKYFKEKGKDSIKYILLQGTIGNVSTTNRTASLLLAFEDNKIKAEEATAPLCADWDRATAMDMISPLVDTIQYDCIVGNNDAMALGAIEALKAKGMDPKAIPIVGIDATADGRQAVKDGEMYMTVFQNAEGQGFGACMAAINMIIGKPINEGTSFELDESGFIAWVPFEPVNKDNVADYD